MMEEQPTEKKIMKAEYITFETLSTKEKTSLAIFLLILGLVCSCCCLFPLIAVGLSGNITMNSLLGPDYVGRDYRDVKCSDNKYQGIVREIIPHKDNYEIVVDIYDGDKLIRDRQLVTATLQEVVDLGLTGNRTIGTIITLYTDCNSFDEELDDDDFDLTNPRQRNTDGIKAFFVIIFIVTWILFLGICVVGIIGICCCCCCSTGYLIEAFREGKFEELNGDGQA